jgi:hypothetical protein
MVSRKTNAYKIFWGNVLESSHWEDVWMNNINTVLRVICCDNRRWIQQFRIVGFGITSAGPLGSANGVGYCFLFNSHRRAISLLQDSPRLKWRVTVEWYKSLNRLNFVRCSNYQCQCSFSTFFNSRILNLEQHTVTNMSTANILTRFRDH